MTPEPVEVNRAFEAWRALYSTWRKNPTEENYRARKAAFADFVGSAGAYLEGIHRETGKGGKA